MMETMNFTLTMGGGFWWIAQCSPHFQTGKWWHAETWPLALGHIIREWWVGIRAHAPQTPEPMFYPLRWNRRKEAGSEAGDLRQKNLKVERVLETISRLGAVAHACNPSTLGG